MTLVRRGALDTSALANSEKTDVTAPTDLVIAPLSVDVIVVAEWRERNRFRRRSK